MTKCSYIFLIIIIPYFTFGQNCDCEQLLKESIQKVENAYVGYSEKFNSRINKKIKVLLKESTKQNQEYSCAKLIFKYISLFEERHMSLILADSIFSSKKLKPLTKNHFLNGEWSNRDGSYSVTFKKSIDNTYIGIITKSKNPNS